MDIAEWLRGLGLGQYETAFRENEVDADILGDLTETDLEKLGLPLGHRKRLLKAIASLDAAAAAPTAPVAPARSPVLDGAERRQITVMFCDLVGSTALSARLDPEDLRGVIGTYHRCCGGVVEGNGGFVAQYLGDGVMTYFGYPQAHEHDAERAVRAGLSLVEAVPRLVTAAGAPLGVRVGIATGMVVVGDLMRAGETHERGVVGETPNLAARLQGVAEAGTVVIADNTRRLIGDLFELDDLGAKDLKGVGAPVRAWAALRARPMESRFEALHGAGSTELVGREEEFELLLRRWGKAKAGEGQVVLVSGEAGIGKSRLTAALLEGLAGEPHTRLRYFCSPQHTDSAFHPIIGQLERAAALAHDDAPQAKLGKLDALLAHTATSREDAALFAELLSLPGDGRYPAPELDAQQRRQRTLQALGAQMASLARADPVLMIFEDAHWSDPTSLEAFGRTVERLTTLRVLLIVTYRPEFEPPWIGRPHVTALTLNRLAQRDIGALIDRVIGNKPLAAAMRADIIERTDGIPLFVEEMTKAVLEAEDEDAALRTAAAVPSHVPAVPPSLHASLMARLDRLGSAKEVAQVGAAIGREFSHALLAAVAGKPQAELAAALDRLVAAGLLFRQGVASHASYLFKHALVQDAAYGTLLREPRRALHAGIAAVLERDFPNVAERQPELLARHCAEAGLVERAAHLWGRAGQRSLERSALVEAIEQFTRALDLIVTLPGSPALRREEIRLQVAIITPLLHIQGYAAPKTIAAAERAVSIIDDAEKLGEPPEDPLMLFSALYGVWTTNYVAARGSAIRSLSARFMMLAEEKNAADAILIAHRVVGISLACAGELVDARIHFDQGISLYDPVRHRCLASRFSVDNRVSILSYRSWTLWFLGYPDAALADADQAISDARAIGHAATLMYTLGHTPFTYLHCGRVAKAGSVVEELIVLAEEKGSFYWRCHATLDQGWLRARMDSTAEAVELITRGLAAWRSTGHGVWVPMYLSYLAFAHSVLGQSSEAECRIEEAIAIVETSQERWCEAEVHRVAGEIALMSPERDTARAAASFERSLTIARAQKAKSWELRTATSLARLRRDQGRRDEARALLARVYDCFTEGFATRDLQDAAALLNELGWWSRRRTGGKRLDGLAALALLFSASARKAVE